MRATINFITFLLLPLISLPSGNKLYYNLQPLEVRQEQVENSRIRRSVFDTPTFTLSEEVDSGGERRGRRFIFDAPTIYGATCSGSIEIETKDGTILILRDTVTRTRLRVERIKVHGCGCYSLHSGRHGRGSKQVVFPAQTWDKSEIGFPKIRSIFRIQC